MTTTVKVRWLFQRNDIDGGAQKPSLCFEGRKSALCVVAGHPVRVLKRPVIDVRRARPVLEQPAGTEFPAASAAKRLTEIGESNGITAPARRLLRLLMNGGASADVDEDAYDDEEDLAMKMNENPNPISEGEGTTTADESNHNGDTTMTTKNTTKAKNGNGTKAKAKAPAKTAAKAKSATKAKAPVKTTKSLSAPKGASKMSQAVEYMITEVKKAGGHAKLERGYRSELIERTAKKFGLAAATCSTQYSKRVAKAK